MHTLDEVLDADARGRAHARHIVARIGSHAA